ncbi:hypothetical protein QGN29_10920 [Temperatibacter marinus]|uniref:Uncharacterized protein n=1 Tax=Temperatibacter marinus TaxID=1456591 RepID=A0AA52EGF2_9PROT|nr:hypothetical protein [Temperatibacter marinus]WND02059.1 hypothetical protein QGN29_10920 [Temperatibacter marinus]
MPTLSRAEVLALPELPFARPTSSLSEARIVSQTMTSHRQSQFSQALSGRIMTKATGAQWFEMHLTFSPMRAEQALRMIGFLEKMQGRIGYCRIPLFPDAGSSDLTVGSYVNYSNHSKLYVVTSLSGASPTVAPRPLNEGGSLIVPSTSSRDDHLVYMAASLKSDHQSIEVKPDGLNHINLTFIERLE